MRRLVTEHILTIEHALSTSIRYLPVLAALGACWRAEPSPSHPAAAPRTPATYASPDGTARVVERTDKGGVIALHGDRDAALERAYALMSKHCGEHGYTVVEEHEEPVRSDSPEMEWRVHYACSADVHQTSNDDGR